MPAPHPPPAADRWLGSLGATSAPLANWSATVHRVAMARCGVVAAVGLVRATGYVGPLDVLGQKSSSPTRRPYDPFTVGDLARDGWVYAPDRIRRLFHHLSLSPEQPRRRRMTDLEILNVAGRPP
jgi:hypothetical protein